jgi:hypothetical protein
MAARGNYVARFVGADLNVARGPSAHNIEKRLLAFVTKPTFAFSACARRLSQDRRCRSAAQQICMRKAAPTEAH